MTPPIGPLFTRSLKGWLSAKGFWVVLAAALVPLLLTGAWVGTHRADIAVTGLDYTPGHITQGDNVTVTAHVKNIGPTLVGSFNASVLVGTISGGQPVAYAQNVTRIDGLKPGETRDVSVTWNATPGVLFFYAEADPLTSAQQVGSVFQQGEIPEVDETNNFNLTPIVVAYAAPNASAGPTAPGNLTGDPNATAQADLAVTDLVLPDSGAERVATVTVKNNGPNGVTGANVTLRVGQDFGAGDFFWPNTTTVPVDLAAGASQQVNLTFDPAPSGGVYWAEAYVEAPSTVNDTNAANNHATANVVVNPTIPDNAGTQTEAQRTAEKATVKDFYLKLIILLHLTVLVPLIALFYAGGVISDERDRKTLGYVLTKPTPRWAFPLVKFVASFVVAGIAIVVGLVLTYLLLFGTVPTGGGVGFLTTPILVSLLALLVYGALFAFLGVAIERPYMVGLLIVLGWENAAFFFVPWVRNLTLKQHVVGTLANADYANGIAINGYNWPLDQGFHLLPTVPDGVKELWIVLLIAVACLVGAAYTMKQKEFEL
jgi:ABC-type transport system involved in multi-copper enzyme maturation permease subunit